MVTTPLQFEWETHHLNGIPAPMRFSSFPNEKRPAYLREVQISLQPEDLASVRFTFSPVWECVAAFRAWMNPHTHPLLSGWKTQVTGALQNQDWTLLSNLALVTRGIIPDFVCPPPTTPMPHLSDELETVRRAPENVIRSEIRIAYGDNVPPSLKRAMNNPIALANNVADLIQKFWDKAISPYWALLRARLEGEMLFRAHTLAVGGFEDVLSGLHRDVSLSEGRLTVRTISCWDGTTRERGLVLVPSIFAWPDVFLTIRPPWRTAIFYPSRGIADLWDCTSYSCSEKLQQLVGPSCAKVIANLQVPRTTLEMSAALGLSPAATSEQITKLWSVGILERTRVGRRVFYHLNAKGITLLTAFGSPPAVS